MIPDISLLSVNDTDVRTKWLRACGTKPSLKAWESMRRKDKEELLHSVAELADDDSPGGDYLTAYEEIDVDELPLGHRSVEHVVPRSYSGSDAHNDPCGMIVATRKTNSRRSNHPLMLWPDPDGSIAPPRALVRFHGVLHFVPPMSQRGRLARKWLFVRATYSSIVELPSQAQIDHLPEIVALAKTQPIFPAERRVNETYRSVLNWANPLLEDGAEHWYDDAKWRGLMWIR